MKRLVLALSCSLAACAALAAPAPKGVDFSGPGWDRPVDPDGDCKLTKSRAALSIAVPGKDHDLDPERKRTNAPRLLRDVRGDFLVEVRVRGDLRPSGGPPAR